MQAKYARTCSTLFKKYADRGHVTMLLDYAAYRIGEAIFLHEKPNESENEDEGYIQIPPRRTRRSRRQTSNGGMKRIVFAFDEENCETESKEIFNCLKLSPFDRTYLSSATKGMESDYQNEHGRFFGKYTIFDSDFQICNGYVIEDDFFEKLGVFESENKKRYAKVKDDGKIEVHKLAFFLSGGSTQIYDWCYRNLVECEENFNNLWWIVRTRDKYRSKQHLLKRGTVTAYNGTEELDELMTELMGIVSDAKTVKVISMFNTEQRKILKRMKSSDKWTKKHTSTMVKLSKLPKARILSVIKKASSVTDEEKLVEMISVSVGETFWWSRNSFITHMDGIGRNFSYDIRYDRNNVIVAEVYDFETISYIAKTTSWCISRDSDYWNNYTSNPERRQFVVINFNLECGDDYSIIGVTTHGGRMLYAAHSLTNNDLIFSPNPYIGLPRNRNITEYLSEIGVTGAIVSQNCLFPFHVNWESPFTDSNIMRSFPRNLPYEIMNAINVEDYSVIKPCEGKIAIVTDNYACQDFMDRMTFYTMTMDNIILFVFCYDLNDSSDISKAMRVIMFSECSVSAVDCLGMRLCYGSVLSLLDEYHIDPSDYIPMSDSAVSEYLKRIRGYDMKGAVSVLAEDPSILGIVHSGGERVMKPYISAINEMTLAPMLTNYRTDGSTNPLLFPACEFVQCLHSNGIFMSKLMPKELSAMLTEVNNQYWHSEDKRDLMAMITFITENEPEWRECLTDEEAEDIDKILGTISITTSKK